MQKAIRFHSLARTESKLRECCVAQRSAAPCCTVRFLWYLTRQQVRTDKSCSMSRVLQMSGQRTRFQYPDSTHQAERLPHVQYSETLQHVWFRALISCRRHAISERFVCFYSLKACSSRRTVRFPALFCSAFEPIFTLQTRNSTVGVQLTLPIKSRKAQRRCASSLVSISRRRLLEDVKSRVLSSATHVLIANPLHENAAGRLVVSNLKKQTCGRNLDSHGT